jgi:DNA-binding beta-propeller fold protein YncE
VNKWAINATIDVSVMYVDKECYGLFVDISDTLYCSIGDRHQVVAKSLNSGSNTVVAGTGCPGSTSDMLYFPRGIFVDTNLDLYVTDCFNNRIQLFHLGQLIGLTVAGNGASGAFTLSCPTGVVLDADKYLFIVDSINHRIIGSGLNGFRCIVGCSGSTGSSSDQLNYPQSMAFDSYGNIYVTDQNNHRIQKFIKVNNNGGKCHRSS